MAAPTVIKLGSSIVADDRGEVRADVVSQVVDQAADLHAAGREVVLVTSGAIARGMRLMDLGVRPRAMDDLQAASAVGQGKLYRVYDELLAARGLRSAQVLLTFFDISARSHYLNARQTLRRLLDWNVVPVINENDTTTTDEISFGDNDFLAAQLAILLGAELLLLLTDTDGLYTSDPRVDPSARLIPSVEDFERLEELSIGVSTSPLGSGGMRSKVVAAEMATAAGIPAVILNGTRAGSIGRAVAGGEGGAGVAGPGRGGAGHARRVDRARRGGRAGGHALRGPAPAGVELQAVAEVREAFAWAGGGGRGGRARPAGTRHVAAAGRRGRCVRRLPGGRRRRRGCR